MSDHQHLDAGIRDFLQGAFSGSAPHFDRYVAEHVRCWGFPEFDPRHRGEYLAFFNFLLDVFAEPEWSIEQLHTSESEAVVCLRIEGIHHEEFMGLPATQCRLALRARLLFILRDGLITETWMYEKSVKLTTTKGKCFELQPAVATAPLLRPVAFAAREQRTPTARLRVAQ